MSTKNKNEEGIKTIVFLIGMCVIATLYFIKTVCCGVCNCIDCKACIRSICLRLTTKEQ